MRRDNRNSELREASFEEQNLKPGQAGFRSSYLATALSRRERRSCVERRLNRFAQLLGRIHHVGQGAAGFFPFAGFQAAVRVHP